MYTQPATSLRDLPRTVADKFNRAKAAQALVLSATQLVVLRISDAITLQLRYCPSLNKKPSGTTAPAPSDPSRSKPDPFETPSADLLVTSLPETRPTHNLVLNKFPVIANHAILATTANKPQTSLLEQDDLCMAYACVQAYQSDPANPLFVFFNSGEHSGASQAHRHLQCLAVADMRGTESPSGWSLLCDTMTEPVTSRNDLSLRHNPSIPFVHYAVSLSAEMQPDDIYRAYRTLLGAASCTVRQQPLPPTHADLERIEVTHPGTETVEFSYNLAMTSTVMAIMPRQSEVGLVRGLPEREGIVNVNGTILAGTVMVKQESEWDALRERPELLHDVLQQIGFPNRIENQHAS